MIGGGAISSGAYRIPAMSSAWSLNDSGGRWGGASGWVRAARSVAVRSSNVSVSAARCHQTDCLRRVKDIRSGTGPRCVDADGITARVTLIMSSTEAIEFRPCGVRVLLM